MPSGSFKDQGKSVCGCGHTMSDHRRITVFGKAQRLECEWFECPCIKFILDHTEKRNLYLQK